MGNINKERKKVRKKDGMGNINIERKKERKKKYGKY